MGFIYLFSIPAIIFGVIILIQIGRLVFHWLVTGVPFQDNNQYANQGRRDQKW